MKNENPKRLDFDTAKKFARMMGVNITDDEIREKVAIAKWITDNFKALTLMYADACMQLHREQSHFDFVAFCSAAYKRLEGADLALGEGAIMVMPKSKLN